LPCYGQVIWHLGYPTTKSPTAISSSLRCDLSSRFAKALSDVQKRAGQRVFALSQKLRCFTEHVGIVAGEIPRTRIREWIQQRKDGWFAIFADTDWFLNLQILTAGGFAWLSGHCHH
jgi:hypothetical protein